MSRLNHHIDLMYNWHRLKRKLRVRDPLHEHEVRMLRNVASAFRMSDDVTRAFIALQNLSNYKPFFAVEVNQWFLKKLKLVEGDLFPSIQQIENYKRAYWQFLCTQLAEATEPQKYLYEVETNATLHSFAEGVVRFEQKFVHPVKQIYRS